MIDINSVRDDTPSVSNLIHFNNAGTSMMAQPVFEAWMDYLAREQEIGGYEAAIERQTDTKNFYQQAAKLVHCEPGEIAFSESATRAWQSFFYGVKFNPGSRIVTSQLDYGSNFVGFIQQHNRHGAEIVVVDSDANGEIDLVQFEREVDHRTALVSISHIPTANGIINPAAAVGKIAQSAGVPYLLDACQSIGQIDVDAKEIGCTAMSTTGRKYLRGPRGTGFLYVDKQHIESFEPPWLDQHSVNLVDRGNYELCDSAQRFENFETAFAARICFGKALEYANKIGINNIEQRIIHLGEYCRGKLASVPGVVLQDQGVNKGGIVMFSLADREPAEVQRGLKSHSINVWSSAGPGSLIDFQRRNIDALVRASIHYFNTEQEIDRMVEMLPAI